MILTAYSNYEDEWEDQNTLQNCFSVILCHCILDVTGPTAPLIQTPVAIDPDRITPAAARSLI